MRRFVRHPTDIPIVVRPAEIQSGQDHDKFMMTNVSQGGLSCEIDNEVPIGCRVEIHIPFITPGYRGTGEVVWCRPKNHCFEIGVRFTDCEEAYKSRMVQQICQIEHYKKWVFEQEGRLLDGNEAAVEWIEKYASDF